MWRAPWTAAAPSASSSPRCKCSVARAAQQKCVNASRSAQRKLSLAVWAAHHRGRRPIAHETRMAVQQAGFAARRRPHLHALGAALRGLDDGQQLVAARAVRGAPEGKRAQPSIDELAAQLDSLAGRGQKHKNVKQYLGAGEASQAMCSKAAMVQQRRRPAPGPAAPCGSGAAWTAPPARQTPARSAACGPRARPPGARAHTPQTGGSQEWHI